MQRLHGRKVIVLTRGDLAGAAVKRNAKTIHSGNGCRDASVNHKKSAEAIVPKFFFREGPNNGSL
jgi:hypothetical protein